MTPRYLLIAFYGGKWHDIASADTLAEVKKSATNLSLRYSIIDTDTDRVCDLDVGRNHCRIGKWTR